MRKVLGTIFYIVAGFFVYMVCLLAFINQPAVPKWGIVAGFSVPALLFLCVGLAVNRFQNWKRHSGIVLLFGVGVTCFLVFTFVCLLMTDEFRQMLRPDTLSFFSSYVSGGVFMLSTGVLGIFLLKTEKKEAEPSVPGDA